jgi:hypothetical protein
MNKLITNKPNTRNHMRKHRTTCNKVNFGNDANNTEMDLGPCAKRDRVTVLPDL